MGGLIILFYLVSYKWQKYRWHRNLLFSIRWQHIVVFCMIGNFYSSANGGNMLTKIAWVNLYNRFQNTTNIWQRLGMRSDYSGSKRRQHYDKEAILLFGLHLHKVATYCRNFGTSLSCCFWKHDKYMTKKELRLKILLLLRWQYIVVIW